MAKQIRYGAYEDFKPEKMVTAELACVVSGDPAVSDGRSVYVCFTPGVVKRLTTYADFERELEAESEEIRSQFTQDIKDAIQDALDAKNAAETFVEQKGQEIDGLITETQKTTSDFVQQAQSDVNTAVTSANASKQAADEATKKALDAADKANAAASGDTAENTVTFDSGDAETPTAWSSVPVIQSGEKHKSLFYKLSTMAKNVRYLWKLIGNNDISEIGDATVTGALAALMRDKLNATDVVDNLLSTDGNKALSAAMGKQLQGAVDELNTSYNKRCFMSSMTDALVGGSSYAPSVLQLENGLYLGFTRQSGNFAYSGIFIVNLTNYAGGTSVVKIGGQNAFMQTLQLSIDTTTKKLTISEHRYGLDVLLYKVV